MDFEGYVQKCYKSIRILRSKAKNAISSSGFWRGHQGTLAQGRVDLYPHVDCKNTMCCFSCFVGFMLRFRQLAPAGNLQANEENKNAYGLNTVLGDRAISARNRHIPFFPFKNPNHSKIVHKSSKNQKKN